MICSPLLQADIELVKFGFSSLLLWDLARIKVTDAEIVTFMNKRFCLIICERIMKLKIPKVVRRNLTISVYLLKKKLKIAVGIIS